MISQNDILQLWGKKTKTGTGDTHLLHLCPYIYALTFMPLIAKGGGGVSNETVVQC